MPQSPVKTVAGWKNAGTMVAAYTVLGQPDESTFVAYENDSNDDTMVFLPAAGPRQMNLGLGIRSFTAHRSKPQCAVRCLDGG
jgi:hypothetical protein